MTYEKPRRLPGVVEVKFALPVRNRVPVGQQSPRRKGGRKATATGTREPRAVQLLVTAIHFQEALDSGEARDYAFLALLNHVTRCRVSQIMSLRWLAPDIQEEILFLPPESQRLLCEVELRSIAREPRWNEQRILWVRVKVAIAVQVGEPPQGGSEPTPN